MKPRTVSNPAVRVLSAIFIVAGVVLTLAALFADELNLTGGGVGLGWKQLIAAIGGLVLLLLGISWIMQPPLPKR